MQCTAEAEAGRPARELGKRLARWRPWVQTAFAAVWLAPLGRWLHGIPGCVFHCYSCPASAFGCPIGIAANYAALFPVAFEIPFLLIGVLLVTGAVVGSLVCGWACPFGFIQDLLGKVSPWKVRLPRWTGLFRYAVLIGLVIGLPMFLGARGIPFEEQPVSICRLCPAGALEAGLPYSMKSAAAGQGWLMSGTKSAILVGFVVLAVTVHRPWCRVFCPLGGMLALFNRWSFFHLRYKSEACIECNLCRSRCSMGVHVDEKVNVTGCIRCLECTTCGALEPAFGDSSEKAAEV
jgi:polyferredoxin